MNAGAIAGGVVGGVAGLLLIAGAAALLYRRRHRQHAHTRQPFQGPIDSDDDDERAAGEDRYRVTVQGIVTPFTHAGTGTDTHSRQEKTRASNGLTAPVQPVVRESDSGPLPVTGQTLPPLYDPSWQSPDTSSGRAATVGSST